MHAPIGTRTLGTTVAARLGWPRKRMNRCSTRVTAISNRSTALAVRAIASICLRNAESRGIATRQTSNRTLVKGMTGRWAPGGTLPLPDMALTATLHRFQLELADIDRGVYESLDFRVARHPSEDEARVIVRVLAYAIAWEVGLEFGKGLSTVDEPALWAKSDTGEVSTWIDVGIPAADRLHRASKRAGHVVVVTHKQEAALRKAWGSQDIHAADRIELVRLDPAQVGVLAEWLDRTVSWYVTIQDGLLTVAQGDQSVDGTLQRETLAEFVARGG